MIITKSNILLGRVPTIAAGVSEDLPQNLTDPDFSTIYQSSDPLTLVMDFGPTDAITYVAVAGINIADGEKIIQSQLSYVRVLEGTKPIKTNQIIRNNCVVLAFESMAFLNLRIELKRNDPSGNPICSFVAAGDYFEVPNDGETAGYNRQFLNRNIARQVTANKIAAPTSVLIKKKLAKGTLTLPSMLKGFSEGEYQEFLDFAQYNYFFIQEQQIFEADPLLGVNSSAYLCFNLANNAVKANAGTRALNDISISFSVFNGL